LPSRANPFALTRTLAIASVLLWLSVGVAGRIIGFL
jgi:hypothetical protein